MQFAILGDIHSSLEDLQAVLKHIKQEAPRAKLIGTGDLYECTVSKKDLRGQIYPSAEEVIQHPAGFDSCLDFPAVYGNQEERILLLTERNEPLRNWISDMPETLQAEEALIIHGHQWPYKQADSWLAEHLPEEKIVFHGHTHQSGCSFNGKPAAVEDDKEILLPESQRAVINVGAVVVSREWLLYDTDARTIRFMKV